MLVKLNEFYIQRNKHNEFMWCGYGDEKLAPKFKDFLMHERTKFQ